MISFVNRTKKLLWTLRTWAFAVCSTSLLMGAAGVEEAAGQLIGQERLVATPTFGWSVPRGDMGDYLSSGPTFGLQVMYALSPRIAVGVDTGFDTYEGTRLINTVFTGPPSQIVRYGVNGEFALAPRQAGSFTFDVGAGVGMAKVVSEPMFNPTNPGGVVGGPGTIPHSADPLQFSGSHVSPSGLLRLGYMADATTTLFVEGHAYSMSLDADKTRVFIEGDPSLEAPTSWLSASIRLGLRKTF